MNLLLGNPALLPALALGAVPVLLHLFARARPRPLPFSSTRFIEQILRQTARVQRPRSWLILILRTLLVLAILAMFLKPVLMHGDPLADRLAAKSVILVVDASASMAAPDGARTRFATAIARAHEILHGLGPADRANVIWLRATADPILPAPAPNKSALAGNLRRAAVTTEAADVPGALRLAAAQASELAGSREIFVISDFQASNWRDLPPLEPDAARVVWVRVGDAAIGNQAVTRIVTANERPLAGMETEVLAEVANFSDQPVLRSVFLRSGELTDRREVRVRPWQTATVAFLPTIASPGPRAVEIALEEDAFPFDNRRWAPLDVRPNLRVALAGQDASTLTAWRRALAAIEWVHVEASESVPKNVDALFLAAPDAAMLGAAESAHAAGAVIVLLPPEGRPAGSLVPVAFRREKPADPLALRVGREDHPALRIFEGGALGNPAAGRVPARHVSAAPVAEFRPLLEFADGQPALAEHANLPRVLWWLFPLEDGQGVAERPEFVPLLGELLLHLAATAPTAASSAGTPGQPLTFTPAEPALDDEVELRHGGTALPVQPLRGEDAPAPVRYTSSPQLAPGAYEWLVRGGRAASAVVNFPAVESDLRLLAELPAGPAELPPNRAAATLREGTPLWPWLLAAACALALLEALVVWRSSPGGGAFRAGSSAIPGAS